MFRRWLLPALAAACFCFVTYQVLRTHQEAPDLEPIVMPARAPYPHVVAASGLVEPVSESIAVGSPLAGVVEEVAVSEGQRVAAGDLLFRLDDRELKAQLLVRQADLAQAKSNLERVESRPRPEEIPPSAAKVRRAEAQLAAEVDLYSRREKLSSSRAVSEQELISARQAAAAAREAVAEAQAAHELLLAGSWGPDKDVARAEVKQAEALVDQTKTDLARLEVRAPISGDILKTDIHRGEYVSASHGQSLVVIGDLNHLRARVTIDEQDLPRFRPGRPGRGFARGGAETPLELTFVRVEPFVQPKRSLNRDSSERVDTRVLEVLYALPPGAQTVYVGQQLDVFIEAETSIHDGTAERQLTRK
ncbi:MAG TPA: HlyD family efflux transporter periplasmic adaptor subunit [Pirellulales bacterium]|jgi:multidrug efflux pump subunit AcrA (membrane-fusion protein)